MKILTIPADYLFKFIEHFPEYHELYYRLDRPLPKQKMDEYFTEPNSASRLKHDINRSHFSTKKETIYFNTSNISTMCDAIDKITEKTPLTIEQAKAFMIYHNTLAGDDKTQQQGGIFRSMECQFLIWCTAGDTTLLGKDYGLRITATHDTSKSFQVYVRTQYISSPLGFEGDENDPLIVHCDYYDIKEDKNFFYINKNAKSNIKIREDVWNHLVLKAEAFLAQNTTLTQKQWFFIIPLLTDNNLREKFKQRFQEEPLETQIFLFRFYNLCFNQHKNYKNMGLEVNLNSKAKQILINQQIINNLKAGLITAIHQLENIRAQNNCPQVDKDFLSTILGTSSTFNDINQKSLYTIKHELDRIDLKSVNFNETLSQITQDIKTTLIPLKNHHSKISTRIKHIINEVLNVFGLRQKNTVSLTRSTVSTTFYIANHAEKKLKVIPAQRSLFKISR